MQAMWLNMGEVTAHDLVSEEYFTTKIERCSRFGQNPTYYLSVLCELSVLDCLSQQLGLSISVIKA